MSTDFERSGCSLRQLPHEARPSLIVMLPICICTQSEVPTLQQNSNYGECTKLTCKISDSSRCFTSCTALKEKFGIKKNFYQKGNHETKESHLEWDVSLEADVLKRCSHVCSCVAQARDTREDRVPCFFALQFCSLWHCPCLACSFAYLPPCANPNIIHFCFMYNLNSRKRHVILSLDQMTFLKSASLLALCIYLNMLWWFCSLCLQCREWNVVQIHTIMHIWDLRHIFILQWWSFCTLTTQEWTKFCDAKDLAHHLPGIVQLSGTVANHAPPQVLIVVPYFV